MKGGPRSPDYEGQRLYSAVLELNIGRFEVENEASVIPPWRQFVTENHTLSCRS